LPVVALVAPRPALELDVELRVRAHALLADRLLLARAEARAPEVDRAAHDREREREHDAVGRDGLRGRALAERQLPAPRRGLADRDELGAGRDLTRERLREERRDLVVAAAHVVLL